MSEIEAAGAAATAGLVAGAIERKGGAGSGPPTGPCPNCGAELAGAYCHACGQPADISRTLGDVVGDFLHAFLHFDTKAWRTLPQLALRPGTMTHAYIHGQRARYVSPLAMFLFSVFLMFLVIQSVTGDAMLEESVRTGPVAERVLDVPAAEAELRKAQEERDADARELAAARIEADAVRKANEPGAGGMATGILAGPEGAARRSEARLALAKERLVIAQRTEARKAELEQASKDLKAAQKEVAAEAPALAPAVGVAQGAVEKAAKGEKGAVDIKLDNGIVTVNSDDRNWKDDIRESAEKGELKTNTGWARLDRGILAAARNPDLALYKLQDTASKYSFLLVPLTLPFIAFLFLFKRGVTLFDHVVFSLYSLSFMSLLFIALGLLSLAGSWTTPVIVGAMLTLPAVHMFFHIGGTYQLGWWSAFWRTVLLLFFIMFVAVIFAVAIALLGVLS